MTKPAKFATLFAVAMVLLFGLCSVGAMHSMGANNWWSNAAVLAGVGCVVCVVGLVVSLIWMVVARKPR